MSRGRFGLLVALLFLLVAGAAFAIGVALLDDDGPDTPPGRSDETADAGTGDTTGTAPTPTTTTTAPAEGPMWIAVVSSEGSEAEAAERADSVQGAGLPTGVLHSDDYESLNPGLWVAFAGPYSSAAEAEAAVTALEEEGVEGAYARCAGTDEQCD